MAYVMDFWISLQQVTQQGVGNFWNAGLRALKQQYGQASDETRQRMSASMDTAIVRLTEVSRMMQRSTRQDLPGPQAPQNLIRKPGSAPAHS